MPPIRIGKSWHGEHSDLTLRTFESNSADKEALAQIRNETLRATTPPEYFDPWTPDDVSLHYERGDFKLEGNTWLMFLGQVPVAAALVYPSGLFHDQPPGNFHLYVVPRLWSHGLGSRLLAHLEQAAVARGYPVLETTIAEEDAQSTNFLISHDFNIMGTSTHLARQFTRAPSNANLPGGYALRSLAELGEPLTFYVETANRLGAYDPNYTLLQADELEAILVVGRWDPAGVLLLLDPLERIVGVIRASVAGDKRGYLNEIRLEPASRGKGLGLSMVAGALDYLASKGIERVELDTAGENEAARNLALRAGFEETMHWLHFIKRLLPATAEVGEENGDNI